MPKIIDLTPVLEEGMVINHPYHPRGPVIFLNQRHDFIQYFYQDFWGKNGGPPLFDGLDKKWAEGAQGHGWCSEHVLIHTHLSTHIDAPLHYDPDTKLDAASIPLEKCYGSAIMLDFRHLCEEPYAITIEDLEEAERKVNDKVREDDIVIIHTGWAAKWAYGPNADRWKYGCEPGPGLHKDTPKWFIDRKVKLVGIDHPNLDYDQTASCHVNFLVRERVGKEPIYIVENLVNLEKIPTHRFTFVGFPLPFRDGSGSPIRAAAIID